MSAIVSLLAGNGENEFRDGKNILGFCLVLDLMKETPDCLKMILKI